MESLERDDPPGRMLGWAGLTLAAGGAVAIILLGGNTGLAVMILITLCLSAVLAIRSRLREQSLVWLLTSMWTGFLGVMGIFSVGIIFLIATVFLLAAFIRANW